MAISTKPGLPPGEEERYREFLARQRRLREEEDGRKAEEVPLEEPPLDEAEERRRQERRRLRKRQVVEVLVFVSALALVGSVVWLRRPVIREPSPDPLQISHAERTGLSIEITNSLGMRLRLIPPGTFLMGSPTTETGHRPDEVQHEVHLANPFYMAVTETTQEVYEEVMGNNPSFFAGGASLPVEYVIWHDAIRFCNELSRREGLPEVYEREDAGWICHADREGYRLPVEAEWEYACRAGTLEAFHTGPISPESLGRRNLWRAAWYVKNADGQTHMVAQREPNRWGLYDMLGNVAEWCWDWYALYPLDVGSSFVPPRLGEGRVVRGGGWYSEPIRCRSSARRRWDPGVPWNSGGFRCVMTASGME